ncbi:MAG TPA: glycosyltransferase family 4 protein [Mycobacteriales bacterium]|nr:glycosyltransferase family 4 protein [Mycobacteriales bacterium]
MRLLFFGTYDVRAHPRVEVLMEGFRALGDEVEECDVPLGIDTEMRVRMLRQPWLLVLLAVRIAAAWARLSWRVLRRRPRPDAVVVGYLGQADVLLARRLFPRTPIALDYLVSLSDTATDRQAGGSAVNRMLARADDAAVRATDVVVVDTEEQRVTVRATPRDTTVVVSVGAPQWWFSPPAPLEPAPLRVLFFGLYTPLQGAPVIGRAIALLADDERVAFTMVGTGQDRAATEALARANPRVDWIDRVPPRELPALAAAHHVNLGVFSTAPKGLRVVPNKVYQGAAAGCATVTSDSPPQRTVLGSSALLVPPGDADALAETLRTLAGDPARVDALRDAAYDLAVRSFRPDNLVAPLRARLLGGTA